MPAYNEEDRLPVMLDECIDFLDKRTSKYEVKWHDKSTTSYAMLDFETDIKNLQENYLVIERHILQIQDILLQYFKFKVKLSDISLTNFLYYFQNLAYHSL